MNHPQIDWQWCRFTELDVHGLYAVLARRQQVFILEQNCLYGDADGLDSVAWHLLGWRTTEQGRELVAYLRYFEPGVRFVEAAFGRVLCIPSMRGHGIGRALLSEAIRRADQLHPEQPYRIQAQQYLEDFYAGFGFRRCGEPYLDDDILHVDMLR